MSTKVRAKPPCPSKASVDRLCTPLQRCVFPPTVAPFSPRAQPSSRSWSARRSRQPALAWPLSQSVFAGTTLLRSPCFNNHGEMARPSRKELPTAESHQRSMYNRACFDLPRLCVLNLVCNPCRHCDTKIPWHLQQTYRSAAFTPHIEKLCARPTRTVPGLPAIFPKALALQPPGVPIIVVGETPQHLVEAIPYVCPHGRVCDQWITAAQRFG